MCQFWTLAKVSLAPNQNGVWRQLHLRAVEAVRRVLNRVATRILTRIIPNTMTVVFECVGYSYEAVEIICTRQCSSRSNPPVSGSSGSMHKWPWKVPFVSSYTNGNGCRCNWHEPGIDFLIASIHWSCVPFGVAFNIALTIVTTFLSNLIFIVFVLLFAWKNDVNNEKPSFGFKPTFGINTDRNNAL